MLQQSRPRIWFWPFSASLPLHPPPGSCPSPKLSRCSVSAPLLTIIINELSKSLVLSRQRNRPPSSNPGIRRSTDCVHYVPCCRRRTSLGGYTWPTALPWREERLERERCIAGLQPVTRTPYTYSWSIHHTHMHGPYRPRHGHRSYKTRTSRIAAITAPDIYRVVPLCHRLHSTHTTRVLHRYFADPTIHMSLASFDHGLAPGGEAPN